MESEALRNRVTVAVLSIPDNGMPFIREVNADLMFATGEEMNFHQREALTLLQDFVLGMSELPFGRVKGRVDPLGDILGQSAGDHPLFRCQPAVDDGQIVLVGLFPMLLEEFLRFLTLGKEEDSRGVLIESMDNIDPVTRFRIALAYIIIEEIVGSARLVPLRADGQQPGRFHHHQNIFVLMEDDHPSRLSLFSCALVVMLMLQVILPFPGPLLSGFPPQQSTRSPVYLQGTKKGQIYFPV